MSASQTGTSGFSWRIGRGVLVADAAEHRHRRLGPEWRMAGAHRVQQAPQAELVGAGVDALAPRLLGGHVLRRARDDPALAVARVGGGAGQPEVRDPDPLHAVLEQDVGGLDVAVHQPLRVGRGEARGDLHADPEHLGDRQRPLAVDPLLQRDPRDVLHHEVGNSLPASRRRGWRRRARGRPRPPPSPRGRTASVPTPGTRAGDRGP